MCFDSFQHCPNHSLKILLTTSALTIVVVIGVELMLRTLGVAFVIVVVELQ